MIGSFRGANDFLSNFYPHSFEFEGETYPTAEHAFQAAKTDDPSWKLRIRTAKTPGQAKHLGRRAPLPQGKAAWDARRIEVMRKVLKAKFSDAVLAGQLLATGDEDLVEGNYWNDTFWGVSKGRGQNHLGELLMELREALRSGA